MAGTPKISKSLLKLAYQMLGSKGGQARMKGLKKKDRTALAKKAAEARWGRPA